ncbi:TIGR01777 family oxidoreductase [Acidimicrobiia bacterium EGI L10123]|uniref:TIGR01777 family oxidoreductase n=1 Tax=Salinilacustrithrix flava TaxID=2957203 RepID=UPI003D7C2ED4|nr:TIGR01777 family oxidoreductase [Acidimicrobiia bacterium EGI L10123]
MKVAITGSSGLIGSALVGALRGAGHTAIRLVRHGSPGPDELAWDPDAGTIDAAGLEGVDAVVNLAGAGIGDERWTDERKRLILESRTKSTDLIARTIADLDRKPSVLLSASGIDYYPDAGDEVLTEESRAGDGFLTDVCVQWEGATGPAQEAGIRTCLLRTGIVQSADGGALKKTLLPFKLGVGGRFGSGDQWWSWISIDDHVRAMLHLIESDVEGPVNLTAPNPVTNQAYTKALGRELGRPTLLPIPKLGPTVLLGKELTEALLYTSHRVLPTVLEADGFVFRHPTIETCLAAMLGDDEAA